MCGVTRHGVCSLAPSHSCIRVEEHVISLLSYTHFHTFFPRFGPPLILRVWRDLTHSQFQSVVLKALVGYLREGIRLADVCRSGVLFQCRVMDALPGRAVLPIDADHPFYSPSIDK